MMPISISQAFSDTNDIAGSYHCLQKLKFTHETHEYTLFVKKTSSPDIFQVLYDIPEVGKFKGQLSKTKVINFYFLKWEDQSNPRLSGFARWKIIPEKDAAIKGYYLGLDQQTQIIQEGKINCQPIYD